MHHNPITRAVAMTAAIAGILFATAVFADTPEQVGPPPTIPATVETTTTTIPVNHRHLMETGVSTTTTTTTTVPAGNWRCPNVIAVASRYWPASELPMVDKIAYRESRCNHDSINWNDPTNGNPTGMGSMGWFQVNSFWCWATDYLINVGVLAQRDCKPLLDPEINTRAAFAIWQRSGWRPWGF